MSEANNDLCHNYQLWLLASPETPSLSDQLFTHVASCEDCQAARARFQLIELALTEEEPVEIPRGFCEAMIERASEPPTPCEAHQRWLLERAEGSQLPPKLITHVDSCGSCQLALSHADQLEQELSAADSAHTGLAEAIMGRIRLVAEITPCESYAEWALREPEGTAPPAELSSHAAQCEECSALKDWVELFEAEMASELPAAAPDGLRTAVMWRVRKEYRPIRNPWAHTIRAVAALLLFSVLLGLATNYLVPRSSYYQATRSYITASLVLPEIPDKATYQQRPVLPSIKWMPDKLPTTGKQMLSLGPTGPMVLLIAILWLLSNLWFARRYRTECR